MNTKSFLTVVLIGIFTMSFGQQSASWDKWSWLIGEWVGEGNGQPGQGGGTLSFHHDLDQKILVRKSHTEFPASGNKPPVIHNDLLIIYPDYSGNPAKAIYFDNEGHTINYFITYADQSIVFTSTKIQNMPIFRLTYTLLNRDCVNTKFEFSQDGEKFATYIEGKSKKTSIP